MIKKYLLMLLLISHQNNNLLGMITCITSEGKRHEIKKEIAEKFKTITDLLDGVSLYNSTSHADWEIPLPEVAAENFDTLVNFESKQWGNLNFSKDASVEDMQKSIGLIRAAEYLGFVDINRLCYKVAPSFYSNNILNFASQLESDGDVQSFFSVMLRLKSSMDAIKSSSGLSSPILARKFNVDPSGINDDTWYASKVREDLEIASEVPLKLLAPDGKKIVEVEYKDFDYYVYIKDYETGNLLGAISKEACLQRMHQTSSGCDVKIFPAIAWHPTSKTIAIGVHIDASNGVVFYDLDSKLVSKLFPFYQAGEISSLAWSPDGSKLIASKDRSKTSNDYQSLVLYEEDESGAHIRPVVFCDENGEVCDVAYDVAESHAMKKFAFSPDGKELVSWRKGEKTISVWDEPKHKEALAEVDRMLNQTFLAWRLSHLGAGRLPFEEDKKEAFLTLVKAAYQARLQEK